MDNKHMDFLETVVAEDVALLRKKEQTYGASWKRRGGGGAFFVTARKWDRLENILKSFSWDVFAAIEQDGAGRDGSALAEIRDLRCYLLLIEAEMMSRGVVAVPLREASKSPVLVMPYAGGTFTQELPNGFIVTNETDQLVTIKAPSGQTIGEATPAGLAALVERYPPPGTPEDGGHHARQAQQVMEGYIDPSDCDAGISYFTITDPLFKKDYYLVDRDKHPDLAHLPRLQKELNSLEWQETLPEYRGLFSHWTNEGKWIMDPKYRKYWMKE